MFIDTFLIIFSFYIIRFSRFNYSLYFFFIWQTINRRVRSSIVSQINTKLQISLDRVYQDTEKLKSKYYARRYMITSFIFVIILKTDIICRNRTETRRNSLANSFRRHRWRIGLHLMLSPALETCHDTLWSHLLLDVLGPLPGLLFGLSLVCHIFGRCKRTLYINVN